MCCRKVYEECGKALSDLSLKIVELLGLSLGLPKQKFKKFFEDNDSIIRLNYYPPCNKPELTLGTGPHCDPTSITILHQDHVSGLQVYVDDQWHSIPPIKDSFVINIGDTFMVHTLDESPTSANLRKDHEFIINEYYQTQSG